MALVDCHECKGQVSDEAKLCPHCGVKVAKSGLPGVMLIAGGVLLAVVLLMLLANHRSASDPQSAKKAEMRRVIEACNEEQQRKSYDPATARTLASVCETYELDFIRQYGHRP